MRAPALFRSQTLLAALLIATVVAGTIQVKVQDETNVDVDLHALCEDLARRCWDLDPDDLGMTPVNGFVVPPDGLLASQEWDEGVKLGTKLLGENVMVKVHAEGSANASHSGDEERSGQVPCPGDLWCPDLVVDEARLVLDAVVSERTFSADHCAVVEGSTQPGARRLLRFTFMSPNEGMADLVVGDPGDHPEWFQWGDCHGHWHFKEYADYRLWDVEGYAAWQAVRAAHPGLLPAEILEAYPEIQEHFRSGHKQGFCVMDVTQLTPGFARKFKGCDDQGITRGWADTYSRTLDGQWVDVTGLAPGAYVLEAEVNAERLFLEASYSNNAAAAVVNIG